MEHEDALGLSVEGSEQRLPEAKLRSMFPGMSGDIGSEAFDPAYFLLENHHGSLLSDPCYSLSSWLQLLHFFARDDV